MLSGWPIPSQGGLPNSGIEPGPPALQEDSLPAEPPGHPNANGLNTLTMTELGRLVFKEK